MRYLLLTVLGAMLLGGCASEPRVDSAPPGVSYRFSGDDVAEANRRADRYCAQYGKRAQLQRVTRGDAENIAVYECG